MPFTLPPHYPAVKKLQPEDVLVRLLSDWNGWRAGHEFYFPPKIALQSVRDGIAEFIGPFDAVVLPPCDHALILEEGYKDGQRVLTEAMNAGETLPDPQYRNSRGHEGWWLPKYAAAKKTPQQRRQALGSRWRTEEEFVAATTIDRLLIHTKRWLGDHPYSYVQRFVWLADERGGAYAASTFAGVLLDSYGAVMRAEVEAAFLRHEDYAERGRRWLGMHGISTDAVEGAFPFQPRPIATPEEGRTFSTNELIAASFGFPPEPATPEPATTARSDDDPNWLYGWDAIRLSLKNIGQAAARQVVQRRIERAERDGLLVVVRGSWPPRKEHVRVWGPDLLRFASASS